MQNRRGRKSRKPSGTQRPQRLFCFQVLSIPASSGKFSNLKVRGARQQAAIKLINISV